MIAVVEINNKIKLQLCCLLMYKALNIYAKALIGETTELK